MRIAFWVIGIGIVLYAIHRLGLWMEERGWIYYWKKRGSSGALGSALLEIEALLEPGKQHVLEISQKDEPESSESGDPPRNF